MEDKKIIELYFSRDEQAIELTKEKYGKLLNAVSLNILDSTPDAEECVSDTYLQLWNSIPPKSPSNLSAYACKIVRNLSLNKLGSNLAIKRGSGQANVIIDELSEAIPSNQSVDQQIELMVLTEAINSFLHTLSKESRIIFVKRYWFFKSDDEIAAELSITQSKVRTSLSRTRKKLKSYLIKEGYTL